MPIGTSANNPIDVGPPYPSAELLETVLEYIAASGEVGSIIIDKRQSFSKIREYGICRSVLKKKTSSGLTEIPVKIAQKWKIPVVMILREGGNITGDLSYEAERQRLRDYYFEHGVGVYPTAERALKSLGRMIRYYQKREIS